MKVKGAGIPMKQTKNYSMPRIFLWMLGEVMRTIPGNFIIFSIFDIIHGASYVLTVWISQKFFESMGFVAKGESETVAVTMLLLFLLIHIFGEICNGLSNYPTEFLSPKVLERMNRKLHEKASQLSAEQFENPEILDCLNNARTGIERAYLAFRFVVLIFTFYFPYFIFMAIYLKNLSPYLLGILLLVFIPVILGKVFRFRIFKKVEEDVATDRRKMKYYEKAVCDREYYKETRLLGGYTYFIRMFQKSRNQVNEKGMEAELRHARMESLLRLFTVCGYVGILVLLVVDLLAGRISAGAFAAVFSGVGMMFDLAEEVFGGILQSASRYAVCIVNYRKFLDLPVEQDKNTEKNFDIHQGITFKDVHFTYPGAKKETIRGISLDIPAGKTVAIVGENGSGKTTLVKMMLGLYKPGQGSVKVGGLDTKENDCRKIWEKCSGVFQKFQKYRLPLRDNVIIGEYRKKEKDDRKLLAACQKAELSLDQKTFPEGLETMLSREFGGVDLSGGQWQRIAMARGLYRNSDLIVLDEPTSAIDPLEETRLYQQFVRLSRGRTSIIVTHRLGAAQIADLILVMKDGVVDDMGTHKELMEKNGTYAFLYREQAKWYKE